ncbi:DMT family transporter [Hansschlegelia zhihuaiae]|uniref:DMT family transporter n=1 Tax=Hansschlegelia zhihuaiae TaxID=405005 RepID=A0A4Q0ML41_9HYPH|nr:DMT family transporter [Hansschlegelia zhihuaiae]RXF74380.1 DMT family transporter [Hansschlegelia zhihuaiae]
MDVRQERLGLLLGVIGVVIFGATLPATRVAVPELGFAFVTAGRAAGAGLIALAVLAALRRPVPDAPTLGLLALVSLGVVWGFPLFSSYAMTRASSAHGGVILAILPLATALAGAAINGERPSGRFWGFAALGAALVLGFALGKGDEGEAGLGLGELALIAAVVSAAVGYAISAKVARGMAGWEVISWAVVISLPASVPVAFRTAPADFSAVSADAWTAFLYVTVMSQYVGFFAWNAGLKLGGVARVSQVQLLQTFVTLAIAALVLSEPVDAGTVLFAVGVVAVVALGRRAPIRRA